MKTGTLCTLALTALGGAALADGHGMDGNWESLSCEVRPQVGQDGAITEWFLTREITMSPGRIEADFTTYAGPGCNFALNTLSFAGRVEEVGSSDLMTGAIEANLTIDEYVRITPEAQGFADFLNSAPAGVCGSDWNVGEAQDILADGCALLGVEPDTPTVEYEILAVEGDHLYFGARPVDGTFITSADKRPHALLVPLKRVE